MDQDNWWKELFDQKYLDTYLTELTPERTKSEVDFIVKALDLKPQNKVLDLACGHGRHSIELAKRGFRITGLDYSEPFIEKAKADAVEEDVNIEFVRGDMKQLPSKGEFDVVLMMFTAFGYFDDEQNRKVLKEVNKTLKPQGRFLLDVTNVNIVIKRQTEEGERLPNCNIYMKLAENPAIL